MENIKEITAQACNEGKGRHVNSAVCIASMLANYSREHEGDETFDPCYVAMIADGIVDLLTYGDSE